MGGGGELGLLSLCGDGGGGEEVVEVKVVVEVMSSEGVIVVGMIEFGE
jgi:hypothetical protein